MAPVNCSICGKEVSEYCSTLTCRACHVSITFEDCVNRTTPEELAWKARKAAFAPAPPMVITKAQAEDLFKNLMVPPDVLESKHPSYDAAKEQADRFKEGLEGK